jgi:hypothetical protein
MSRVCLYKESAITEQTPDYRLKNIEKARCAHTTSVGNCYNSKKKET